MSWMDCPQAEAHREPDEPDVIERAIVPRSRDIGGFEVRRALPASGARSVGAFVFFDQMGPSSMAAGQGLDVRPHPHIGLATITYLFDGQILHRDSLGTIQAIEPGAVNWMTAGRGIAHSERSPDALRPSGPSLFGIQAWVALPKELEDSDPAFVHHDAGSLPQVNGDGAEVKLITGELFGKRSLVATATPLLYADAKLFAGAVIPFDAVHEERAIYLVEGAVEIGGRLHDAEQLLLLRPGDSVAIHATRDSRLMLIGGEPLSEPRYLWWNFVSSSKDRIRQAQADWRAGRFAPVVEETESIPLPDLPGP